MIEKQFSLQALLEKATRVEELLTMLVTQQQRCSNSQRYLTIAEAADLVCKSVHTVYGLVSRRQIPHAKIGNRLLFNEDELRSWLEAGKRQTINELFTTKSTTL